MQAIAEALLEGDCYSSSVATRIVAETSGDFGVIEGCERDDFSSRDASGSTSGSTAEGVRSPCYRYRVTVTAHTSLLPHPC